MIAATFDELNGSPTRVELHGPLGEEYGREHNLYISSPGEAIRALCSQFKGFRETMSQPGAYYALMVGGMEAERSIPLEAVNLQSGTQDIHIVPMVEGADKGTIQFIAGAALAVASIWCPALFPTALSLMISGVSMWLAPAPAKAGTTEQSNLFNGPANTVGQGHPIQICYGEIEVGSAVVASMIDYAGGAKGLSILGEQGGGGPGVSGRVRVGRAPIGPFMDRNILYGEGGDPLLGADGGYIFCEGMDGGAAADWGEGWFRIGEGGWILQDESGAYVPYKGE